MVPDFVLLYAVVIVLFPLAYFTCATIPFLFVRLDVPEVARLFRGVFSTYFLMVGGTALLATAAFAAGGRLGFMLGMLLLAAGALALRGRMLQQIDTQQQAFQTGDWRAMRRLRWLHWGSMLANVGVIACVASGVPHILDRA